MSTAETRQCGRLDVAQGFTLVEIMATLVLIAIILPVAMKGISLALRTSDDARARMEATSLAETKLSELVATGDWRSNELAGDFGAEWPDYSWSAEVMDWEGAVLQQVTVRVEWTRRSQDRAVALSTLVYTGQQ